MSTKSSSPKTFTAGEALEPYRQVKISGSTVIYADDEDKADGVTMEAAASGKSVAVDLINAGGTKKVEASGAIAAGADYFADDDGKVNGSGTLAYGKAINAATGAGEIIEVLPD